MLKERLENKNDEKTRKEEKMKEIVLTFINKCAKKNSLIIDDKTKDKLADSLISMARKKQSNGGFYIPDDEMEDLILNFESTIKEYYEEPKPKNTTGNGVKTEKEKDKKKDEEFETVEDDELFSSSDDEGEEEKVELINDLFEDVDTKQTTLEKPKKSEQLGLF